MNTDFDDRLTALFDDLAEQVPVAPVPPLDVAAIDRGAQRLRRRERAGLGLALQAAAIVLVVGGTVAVVATRAGDGVPSGSSPTTPAVSVGPVAAPLFGAAAQPIAWTVVRPDSSIAQAQVSSIAAGPGGFVAVGLGFDGDLTAGQGRVWFSPDGETWAEPDRDLFGPQGVYAVAATADAYYLYAAPTPPTEGSRAEPAQLYRSTDGSHWDPLGEPTADAGQLVTAGDVVLRVGMRAGGMLVSNDGVEWDPAQLTPSASASDPVFFDDRIVASGGVFYVRSWTASGDWGLWSSVDGTRWSAVAVPDTPGRLTGTDGALLSVGDPDEGSCTAGIDPATDPQRGLDAQWDCAVVPAVEQLVPDAAAWTVIGAGPDVQTPTLPGVSSFANQLVAAVEGADGDLSVWVSTNAATWTPTDVEVKSVDPDESDRGSPQAFWVAGQDGSTIIIPVASNGVGDLGQLVVGHIDNAS